MFTRWGPLLGSVSAVPGHALAVAQSVLVLFGADFFGQPSVAWAALALLHLAGVAVAALGFLVGVRRFFSGLDRVGQVLVAGTIFLLGAGIFGTHVPNVTFAHEIAPLLPFCAVLAGRLLAAPLIQARLEPVLAVVLAAYLRCAVLRGHAGARARPEPGRGGLAGRAWLHVRLRRLLAGRQHHV